MTHEPPKMQTYADLIRVRNAVILTLRYDLGWRIKEIWQELEKTPYPQVGYTSIRRVCASGKVNGRMGRPRKADQKGITK